VRRLYFDLLRTRLAHGDLGFPFRVLRTLWDLRRGAARPLLGTLIVTYRCDLACDFCDLPRRGDRKAELGTEELKGVLAAFHDLGVLGVGITGGEPLLRKDTLAVARYGADLGMLMHLNTNGTFVTHDVAREIADSGVCSVNLSLDGPDAATHDRLRGRDGSFARVLRAAARLCAVPDRRFRVAITCALGEGNADGFEALLDRARDVGVDRVGFLPVHDFPANNVAKGGAPVSAAAARLLERSSRDPLLDNSRAYLRLFDVAFRGEQRPLPCTAPRNSVVVDCYGAVFPCVPLNAVNKEVGRGDVRELWRSETYARVRESLEGCRACFWNCHTEMDLALRKIGGGA
jgi:MoaA/NifB/PqqE/SkfB family radical SAM enzyme